MNTLLNTARIFQIGTLVIGTCNLFAYWLTEDSFLAASGLGFGVFCFFAGLVFVLSCVVIAIISPPLRQKALVTLALLAMNYAILYFCIVLGAMLMSAKDMG